MPLGLLQELHSCHMLAWIPIFLPEETKDEERAQAMGIVLPILCLYHSK